MMSVSQKQYSQLTEILLVEDDQADVMLIKHMFKKGRIPNNLHVVNDGVDALEFLRQTGRFVDAPRPDIVPLDLNTPRRDGSEVGRRPKGDTSRCCKHIGTRPGRPTCDSKGRRLHHQASELRQVRMAHGIACFQE